MTGSPLTCLTVQPNSTVPLAATLLHAGIQPTKQRLAIAHVLLQRSTHLTADEVLEAARRKHPTLSRATVYNTLQLLLSKQLIRALHLDAERKVYDSRADSHFHLYHEDTGTLEDVSCEPESLRQVLNLPSHLQVLGLDVIVRVRQRQRPLANNLNDTKN